MNGLRRGKTAEGTLVQLFNCTHANCGATFNRQWRLKEHETVHTGAVRKHFNTCLTVFRNHTSPKMSAAPVSVHSRRMWSSFLTEISPEPPPASARRRETVQVSHSSHLTAALVVLGLISTLCLRRCKFPGCTHGFINAGKRTRHMRYSHGDKTFFKVCVNTGLRPLDGATSSHCNILHPVQVVE